MICTAVLAPDFIVTSASIGLYSHLVEQDCSFAAPPVSVCLSAQGSPATRLQHNTFHQRLGAIAAAAAAVPCSEVLPAPGPLCPGVSCSTHGWLP